MAMASIPLKSCSPRSLPGYLSSANRRTRETFENSRSWFSGSFSLPCSVISTRKTGVPFQMLKIPPRAWTGMGLDGHLKNMGARSRKSCHRHPNSRKCCPRRRRIMATLKSSCSMAHSLSFILAGLRSTFAAGAVERWSVGEHYDIPFTFAINGFL